MEGYIPASLIKEWVWCPVFAWFKALGIEEPLPPHIRESLSTDYLTLAKELLSYCRASWGAEGLNVLIGYRVRSDSLGISGITDILILNHVKALVAEVKAASPWAYGKHVELQLTAYALMTSESFNTDDVEALIITESGYRKVNWRRLIPKLIKVLSSIKSALKSEELPTPTHNGLRCNSCPYSRLCPHSRC